VREDDHPIVPIVCLAQLPIDPFELLRQDASVPGLGVFRVGVVLKPLEGAEMVRGIFRPFQGKVKGVEDKEKPAAVLEGVVRGGQGKPIVQLLPIDREAVVTQNVVGPRLDLLEAGHDLVEVLLRLFFCLVSIDYVPCKEGRGKEKSRRTLKAKVSSREREGRRERGGTEGHRQREKERDRQR